MVANPIEVARFAILAATDPEAFAELASAQGFKPEQLNIPGLRGTIDAPDEVERPFSKEMLQKIERAVTGTPEPQTVSKEGKSDAGTESPLGVFPSASPPQVIPQSTVRPPTPLPSTFPFPGNVSVMPQPSDNMPQLIPAPGQVTVPGGTGYIPPMPPMPPLQIPPVMGDVPTMPQSMLPQPQSGGHGFPLPFPPLMMPGNTPPAQNVVPPQPAPPMGQVPTAPGAFPITPQAAPNMVPPTAPPVAMQPPPPMGDVPTVPGGMFPIGVPPAKDTSMIAEAAQGGDSGILEWLTGLLGGASQTPPEGGFGRSPGQVASDVFGSLWQNSQARATLTGGAPPAPPAGAPAITGRQPSPPAAPKVVATQPVETAPTSKPVSGRNEFKSETAVSKEVADATKGPPSSQQEKIAAIASTLAGVQAPGGSAAGAARSPPSAGVNFSAIPSGEALLALLMGGGKGPMGFQPLPFAKLF